MSLLFDLVDNEFVKADLGARTNSGYRTTLDVELDNSEICLLVRYEVLHMGEICGHTCMFVRNVADPELLDDVRSWFGKVKAAIIRGDLTL